MSFAAYVALMCSVVLGQAETGGKATQSTTVQTTETVVTTEKVTTAEKPEEKPAPTCPDRLFDYIGPVKDFRDALREKGIDLAVATTMVYQGQANGPDTSGSWGFGLSLDVTLTLDFGKLAGIEGLYFNIYMDSAWYDNSPVANTGALNYENWDFGTYGPLVAEYWVKYAREFGQFGFEARVGKINFASLFDTNRYANNSNIDFLNVAFMQNPFFIFAVKNVFQVGFGGDLKLYYKVNDDFVPYFASGLYSTDVGYGRWGIREFFDAQDSQYMWVNELGVNTNWLNTGNGKMPGSYKVGVLYNSEEVTEVNYNTWGGQFPPSKSKGATSFYANFDQMVFKENADPADLQGLGVFFRYATSTDDDRSLAYAPGFGVENFFSFGFNYTGIIPGRDKDVLAFGYAITDFNDYVEPTAKWAGVKGPTDEQILELYYKIVVCPWLEITPDLQYILNPAGNTEVQDALVAGVRFRIIF